MEPIKDCQSECCGNINQIGNDQEWEEIDVTVDSGAYNNVCGKELLPRLGIRETEALKNRQFFHTASKEKLHSLGEKVIRRCNEEGASAGIVFQVVEGVKDNLASVRKI